MKVSRWRAVMGEHETAVWTFIDAIGRIDQEAWQRPCAPGKWSPAAVALHVSQSYEFGRDAIAGGPGMRLRVPRAAAWVTRTVLLPVLLSAPSLARPVKAPAEVAPDLEAARRLTVTEVSGRIERAAHEAAAALQRAGHEHPRARVVHAYFGPLPPYTALRVLSAHTRHHTRGLPIRASSRRG